MQYQQLETTKKIMNLDDVSVNTKILLYYFVSIFKIEQDNNLVVAHGLGKDFEKAKVFKIGTYLGYDGVKGKDPTIELDHLNFEKKIIVDSKYYNEMEKESLDYKQVFYNYHMVYLFVKDKRNYQYEEILEEYKQWKNVLIKPTHSTDVKFSIYKLESNMQLYSLKINIREYVEYYNFDTYKGKTDFDLINEF